MGLDILSCIILSVGVWFSMTLLHELGHVLALNLTKYILRKEYKEKLEIKVLVAFRNGYTDSKLYGYLENKKLYNLIKLNAIFGYAFSLIIGSAILLFCIFLTIISLIDRNMPDAPVISINVYIFFWLYSTYRSIPTSGDLRHYKEPQKFKYNPDIDIHNYIQNINEYKWILVSIIASMLVYILIMLAY